MPCTFHFFILNDFPLLFYLKEKKEKKTELSPYLLKCKMGYFWFNVNMNGQIQNKG